MEKKNVQLRFLDHPGDEALVFRAFQDAFADYQLDMSYMSEKGLLDRMRKNGIDYCRSVGMFAGNRMVGFTFVGIGPWQGRKGAFDTGTGMVKAYRGQRYAGKMLDMIREKLHEAGVTYFVLEVLQQNENAMKAYQKSGFDITREFKCYELKTEMIKSTIPADQWVTVEKRDHLDIDAISDWLDWPPSWEVNPQAVKSTPDRIDRYVAVSEGRVVGGLLFYPNLNWILTLVVNPGERRKGVARALLNHFLTVAAGETKVVKVVNVLKEDVGMQLLLSSFGFENYVDQYEMVMEL